MNDLLIDLQYFPSTVYYLTLNAFKHIEFDVYDRHRKMSFRNRCVIIGANGTMDLSVPLIGGRDQKTISKDVRIDNSLPWQAQHFRSIVSAYRRAPFYEFYETGLERIFGMKHHFLVDWNVACLEWLHDQTRAKWSYNLSDSYRTPGAGFAVTDLRDWFFPRSIFERAPDFLPYRQVFEERHGFVKNLSILDLLFCAGPAAAGGSLLIP